MPKTNETEQILDRLVEGLFRLMLEHHQKNVAEMELTLSQAQAIKVLQRAPLSTSRLATVLGISAPAVSQLTDRLVRKQLIERRAAETDRRSVVVGLTEKGARVIEDFRQRRNEIFGNAIRRLNDPDRTEVIRALEKIVYLLEGREAEPLASQPAAEQSRRRAVERRTAVEPASTSNVIELDQSSPLRRRMRIEWD